MLSIEYVAGFFDGEGCVSVQSGGYLSVIISNRHRDILEMMQSRWGGIVYENGKSGTFQWKTSTREGCSFLHDLVPHLVVKKEAALAGIALAELSVRRLPRDHPDRVAARRRIHEANMLSAPRMANKGEFANG